VYDNDDDALAAILAEWASANSYADRVAHLTGTPGGLNDDTFLDEDSVIHDTAVDILLGGLGDDLFFAKLTSPADVISDKGPNETAL
jgi:hypothetical protein